MTDNMGGVYNRTPKDPTQIIVAKTKGSEIRTMAITIERDNMFEMGTATATIITTGTTKTTENIELDLMFSLKIENLPLGML